MRVGIVGSEAAKFTPYTEAQAKDIIRSLLSRGDVVVSGACHLGGIDVWAAEIGHELGLEVKEYPPKTHNWSSGYKPRNIQIARDSDIVCCITLARLPDTYHGMRFPYCYHCKTSDHVKSGGCWTAHYAQRLGKEAKWYVIP